MVKRRAAGFTLVEIAIVLVIIGLLVGGSLVGRSMIATGETHAAARQIGQFDIAIENFKNKYNCIPGDCAVFAPAGDNDGRIEDASGNDGLGAEFTGEVANFWVHLEQGEGIRAASLPASSQTARSTSLNEIEPASGSHFTATVSGKLMNTGATINIPAAKIGGGSTAFIVTNDYLPASSEGSLRSKALAGSYIIGGIDTISDSSLSIAPSNLTDAITPADAAAMDKKIDDGNADAGSLIAVSQSGACNTGASYNASNHEAACSLVAGYLRLTQARDAATVDGSNGGTCGDGAVDAGEDCDDGNTIDNDGCSSTCVTEFCGDGDCDSNGGGEDCNSCSGDCGSCDVCGDGSVTGSEQCDDWNTSDGDGCNSSCHTEYCSDGIVQAGIGEQCDDGSNNPGDGCDGSCQTETDLGCGYGVPFGPVGDPGWCAVVGGTWEGCSQTCDGYYDPNVWCMDHWGSYAGFGGSGCECPSDPGWCATLGGSWYGCTYSCDGYSDPNDWCVNMTACGTWDGTICDQDPQNNQHTCECGGGTWTGPGCAM